MGAAPAAAAVGSSPSHAAAHAAPVRLLAVYHAPRKLQSRTAPAHRAHRSVHRRLSHVMVFRWPALGSITTEFSSRHDGIDIGSLRSLAITAAQAGRVLHVGYTTGFEGYGNIVDVEIAPGVETLYAHLSGMDVHVGQLVHAGERLGTAGCTGICTGTHLHFEVRLNGAPVNPLRYLP
ncbi:MAG TPA: M23 family metallopeptidase [Gaiellaceae bacterium]|nr:M23 family metallopeptidase [Gaiellaceae bacterium]